MGVDIREMGSSYFAHPLPSRRHPSGKMTNHFADLPFHRRNVCLYNFRLLISMFSSVLYRQKSWWNGKLLPEPHNTVHCEDFESEHWTSPGQHKVGVEREKRAWPWGANCQVSPTECLIMCSACLNPVNRVLFHAIYVASLQIGRYRQVWSLCSQWEAIQGLWKECMCARALEINIIEYRFACETLHDISNHRLLYCWALMVLSGASAASVYCNYCCILDYRYENSWS